MSFNTNTTYPSFHWKRGLIPFCAVSKVREVMLKRINKACSYFPCHNGLEDCTFCYCPFYPCEDKSLGRYIQSIKLKKNIWSCQDCSWIHKKKTADRIYKLIRRNWVTIREDTARVARRRKLKG